MEVAVEFTILSLGMGTRRNNQRIPPGIKNHPNSPPPTDSLEPNYRLMGGDEIIIIVKHYEISGAQLVLDEQSV